MEASTKKLICHFIFEIEYKASLGQNVKFFLQKPIKQAYCPMVWQKGDLWISCMSFLINSDDPSSLFFEYQYMICENLVYVSSKRQENIYITEETTRKIDLSQYNIDFSQANTHFLVKSIDSWGYPLKSIVSSSQILIKPLDKWAIVLGKSLMPDGSPKKELIARIQKLAEFIKKTPELYKKAVLTGGMVGQDIISEAEVMYELCLQQGIQKELLIKEPEAKFTLENAIFTKILAVREGVVNMDLITTKYHLVRSGKIFRRVFQEIDCYRFEGVDDGCQDLLEESVLQRNLLLEKELMIELENDSIFSRFPIF